MKTLINFDLIIAHALETGASKYDYSFQFWEAFDSLYPDVTQKYANILEEREVTQWKVENTLLKLLVQWWPVTI